jgi:hypothetical protein
LKLKNAVFDGRVSRTPFRDRDGKIIPWEKLMGMDVTFIPTIHVRSVFSGTVGTLYTEKVHSAVVIDVKPNASNAPRQNVMSKIRDLVTDEQLKEMNERLEKLEVSKKDECVKEPPKPVVLESPVPQDGKKPELTNAPQMHSIQMNPMPMQSQQMNQSMGQPMQMNPMPMQNPQMNQSMQNYVPNYPQQQGFIPNAYTGHQNYPSHTMPTIPQQMNQGSTRS